MASPNSKAEEKEDNFEVSNQFSNSQENELQEKTEETKTVLEELNRYYGKVERIRTEVHTELANMRNSRMEEERNVIDSLAKHLSYLEEKLESAMKKQDDFFDRMSEIEINQGILGVHEQALRTLRANDMAFSAALSEIQQQRLICNRLVEILFKRDKLYS